MSLVNQTDAAKNTTMQTVAVMKGAPYVPTRPLTTTIVSQDTSLEIVLQQIQDLQAQVEDISNPTDASGAPVVSGVAPLQLLSVSATESPTISQGRTFSEVSVSFTRPGDSNFGSVDIWFTGYKGNTTPELMTSGIVSPVTFLCETTGETVTVTVQPIATDGTAADFDSSKTCQVVLDGVVSAPPAPSISQSLVPTPLGYQFAFNQVTLGSTQDVIDSYRVYKKFALGTMSLLRTFKHSPTNSGAIVVQDNVGGGQTFFYFVSAVNTVGLESARTAAQSVTVVSGAAVLDTDVTDGTIYLRTPFLSSSSVVIENGNFEASASTPVPGWRTTNATLSYETSNPQSGNRSLVVDASAIYGAALSNHSWAVLVGDTYKISGYVHNYGVSGAAGIQLMFLDKYGNYVGGVQTSSTNVSAGASGWSFVSLTGVVPANSVVSYMSLQCYTVGGGTVGFDMIQCVRMSSLIDEVDTVGSIPITQSNGFAYSSTTTSITATWYNVRLMRSDGTETVVPNGTQLISSLTAGKTYYLYPYWDEKTSALLWTTTGDAPNMPTIIGVEWTASTSGYVSVGSSNPAPNTSALSTECWFRTTAAAAGLIMANTHTQTGTPTALNFTVSMTAGGLVKLSIRDNSGLQQAITGAIPINDGNWHHIVCTQNNTSGIGDIYIDSVLDVSSATTTITSYSLPGYWRISSNQGNADNHVIASTVAHAAVYNGVVLAPSVIAQNFYALANGGTVANYSIAVIANGASLYWKLTETAGTSATEYIAANTGTYQGTFTLNQASALYVASGSPAYAWPLKSLENSQFQTRQDHVPLSVGGGATATTTTGTGGGTFGGAGKFWY